MTRQLVTVARDDADNPIALAYKGCWLLILEPCKRNDDMAEAVAKVLSDALNRELERTFDRVLNEDRKLASQTCDRTGLKESHEPSGAKFAPRRTGAAD